jgi:Sec-independent protein translocase protein TatA
MELLGVGPLELILVLVIVLLLFSPKDIVGGARKLGSTLNRLYKSDTFRVIQKTSEELRDLPNRLVQEAALEELKTLPQEITQEVSQATAIRPADILPNAIGTLAAPVPTTAPASPAVSAPAPTAPPTDTKS